MRYLITAVLVLMLSGISHAAELKIGLIPEQNIFKQMKRYKPLGEYIEKKTGIKLSFTILSRYGNIIENFNRLHLDGAFWGSFTGALAIKKLGIRHIVRPLNPDGTSSYRGYIFVRKKSSIKGPKQMKNRVIAFVDKATSAGYIFPLAYLGEDGIRDIDKYFKEYFFTGSHDAAIHSVLNGEADIGCAKNTIFDMLAREDPRVKDNLVILATSIDFPSNGLGLSKDIAPETARVLKDALLGMSDDPEGKRVLEDFGIRKFIETSEKDYAPVFDLANKAGIDIESYNYSNR